MKQPILLLMIALTFASFAEQAQAQTVRYVTPSGAGARTGAGWANASNNLQDMINKSSAGTGNNIVETCHATFLRASTQNGVLYVSGISEGATVWVYNVYGQLIYTTPAPPKEVNLTVVLPGRGVYIVTDGVTTVKTVN